MLYWPTPSEIIVAEQRGKREGINEKAKERARKKSLYQPTSTGKRRSKIDDDEASEEFEEEEEEEEVESGNYSNFITSYTIYPPAYISDFLQDSVYYNLKFRRRGVQRL